MGLKGNLAPEGAIVKIAGMDEDQQVFTGPALIFECEQDAFEAVQNRAYEEGCVFVIRNEGPRGGPGMRGGRGGFGGRGRGRGGFGGGGWNGGGGGEYGGQATEYVQVPSNKCGLIIGKGGETIKNINQTSGAHCEVACWHPGESAA